ncbi:MAG TPA: ATP synthase F0 subunit B [Candidatus Xenobia bacterium]|nr:ATP synthase F0 subunit B [Candidatus Xenobia bacterium]
MKLRAGLALLLLLFFFSAPLLASEEVPAGSHESTQPAAEQETEHGGDTLTTVFKWVNFLTVFGALGYLLRKPMREFFSGQRAAIQAAIAESRQARQQAEQRLAEIEQRLARLGEDVENLRREAAAHAAAEQQRIREAAQRETERILATAQAEIESTRRAARLELRAFAARLAVSLAEQRIRQQLTPEAHAALFASFVAGLASSGREGRA